MYYTDDSILPENMAPLIITAAPYGPEWIPGDADIPVTWDEQVQAAVDCYNAGATMLHVHVRDPATGHGSVDFEQFNYFIGRLKKAVPKMILQVGGSISFSPKSADAKAKWLDYDTRHMLTELDPKPECVTVATGTTQWDIMSWMSADDIKGTHLENNPKVQAAWAGMWVDAGPAFYLEHLKRLRKNRIQPYFVPAHVHQLELIERLIRAGVYMGPMNLAIAGYGGGTLGRNPYHWMEFLRQVPQGASATFWTSMRGLIPISAMAIVLGQHVRVGNEDNLWGPDKERRTTVQQIEGAVRICKEFGRKVATAEEARQIMKIGVWYDSVEETLHNLGLPPTRKDGQTGFLVWETDGKKAVAKTGGDSHPMAYCMVPPAQVAAE
ncbi:3-keto-5-aminohexanoate cleavage protein [Bradyrhizobium sp. Arg816]|uniref:3-keto-5-aminohexanoate cleavage protein n=1 Tax=Bradyrhizobium sp. Arg816 TaxID=2998491 RepID=UPI00249DACF4|nr:3-keto-5-aminohexanoate cleavage protein [Bradyrhizobium sp. Arg816]MDI3564015.1 3-keto-5-aminohexanoate cleavage protein [Bradyrhizobium sp. Arg816]